MKFDTKAIVAEFIGTFALVFIGAGAICTNQFTHGGIGVLGIAIAHGAVLGVMVSSFGHISGGHFNPAVTVAVLAAKKIDLPKAITYVLAQLGGAVIAGYLLAGIFAPEVWKPVHLGTPSLGPAVTVGSAIFLEIILTFFLVLTVFATAIDERGVWKSIAGFGIGTVLTFDILVGGPITGAAMNPARTFGPALASGHWQYHPVYWFGPLIGGLLASYVYTNVFMGSKRR